MHTITHYRGNAKLSTLVWSQAGALRGIQVGRIIWHCRLLLLLLLLLLLHGHELRLRLLRLHRHELRLRLLRLHGHHLRLLLRLGWHVLRLPWRARAGACAHRV